MRVEDFDEYKQINLALTDLIQNMDDSSYMKKMLNHVCSSGGKKIRPLILMLSTEACGGDKDRSINAALAIELIHSASLVHDDLLDGGILRRGMPSAHEKYGVAAALLCGDFLISKATALISSYGNDVVYEFGSAGMHMAEGETIDVRSVDEEFRQKNYFECINKKTASLFASSAAIGAYIAGCGKDEVLRFHAFGENMGIAYQIVDDLLEFLEEQDDKKSTQESVTLPHIYSRTMGREEVLEMTIAEVHKYVGFVKELLSTFRPCDAREKLLLITNHITVDLLPKRI
ncbi:polyprenyl synthetase family protein [uncultured Methanomethylovorans sp.]|uniref:polyprenyl synthetase family protein n=1 Tax=uncultured Methanomethylovorans sp. TaxID=183759 RepID=UPI002AA65343|nr:polyprenyl synthetase family protein [uncultured Methanomethylovorans sp.]